MKNNVENGQRFDWLVNVEVVDDNKKELKKIEQKSTWSEEDEKLFNRICDLIHEAAYENCETNEDGKELGEYAKMMRLLKSLKQRMKGE